VQATVHRFDAGTGTGAVLTDDGIELPFGAESFRGSGLRHLRVGQRLTVTADGVPPVRVGAMWLTGVPVSPAVGSATGSATGSAAGSAAGSGAPGPDQPRS
jgi:cold shock CspA family protein